MPILILDKPFVLTGPGVFTYTIPATGQYAVLMQLTEQPPSSCVFTITKNASLIYTSPVLTPTQVIQQLKFGFQAAAADAIVVTLASSATVDNQKNTVKWAATIQKGL